MSEQPYFDASNRKYKCLCGCCHVTTFTKFICWLTIILVGFNTFVQIILQPSISRYYDAIISLLLAAFIYGTTLYAIESGKFLWMLPLLIVTGIEIISTIITAFFVVITFIIRAPMGEKWEQILRENPDFSPFAMMVLFLIVVSVVLLITAWLFSIHYRCYEYLKEKKKTTSLPLHVQQPVQLYQAQINPPALLKFHEISV